MTESTKPIKFSQCNCCVEPGKFKLDEIPMDCPATWRLISRGHTVGVFQLENKLGQDWSSKVKPENVNELSALTSLLRPGSLESGMSDDYVDIKFGKKKPIYLHDKLKEILEPTYGCMIYQEQAIRIAQEIAGFSLEESDNLRKCVTGDTLFLSKQRGWISINELLTTKYKKDVFLTMDFYGNKKWKKIKDIWSIGKKTVRHVESRSGFCVKATKHHQFLTNSGWIARRRLTQDDFLITAGSVDYDGKDIISEDLAIVLTGIIAEGYFASPKQAGNTFTNYDSKIMNRFKDSFKNLFEIYPKMASAKGVKDRVARLTTEQSRFLGKYIGYVKSKNKQLSSHMMGLTKETTRKFLSYILACEGGITRLSKQFEFSSKSIVLIRQVKLLLLRFGIRSNLYKTYNKKYKEYYYKLYICDYDNQKKLLRELTLEWPKFKLDALKDILKQTRDSQYTLDIMPHNLILKMLNQYPYLANYDGGSVWKKNISRLKFNRLANKTKDPYWINLSNNDQFYDSVESTEIRYPDAKVYDFTMEDDECPYIVANGMVIHNSIGKKLPELMAKLKSRFIDGCEKAGYVNQEDAEKIFGWIEKSQRYSFNLSHARSYADLSYATSWLKCHFPQEFFTSYLTYSNYKQNPKEEICKLVQDARLFGINILLPDIKRKNVNFKMSQDNGPCIFFGLSHIKSVGKSAIKKIIDMAKGELDTWRQFLHAVPNLHRDVAISLIKSGACDEYGLPRTKMIDELNTILGYSSRDEDGNKVEVKGLTKKEKEWFFKRLNENVSPVDILQEMSIEYKGSSYFRKMKKDELIKFIENNYEDSYNNIDGMKKIELFNIIKTRENLEEKDLMPNVLEKRREILKEKSKFLLDNKDNGDSFKAKAMAEKMFLGISLSCSAIDDLEISEETITCLEAAKLPNNSKFNVCGIIEAVKHTKTKKGRNPGQPMCFINFSDSTYAIDHGVVFPGRYQFVSDLCKENYICIFSGTKKNGSFLIEEIKKVI